MSAMAELGEEAVEPLVEAVKRSLDPRARQAAIQALRRLGPAVKDPLLKQMNVGVAADILVKLVPLLEDFAEVSLLPTLTGLLQHPDAHSRGCCARVRKHGSADRARLGLASEAAAGRLRRAGDRPQGGRRRELLRRI